MGTGLTYTYNSRAKIYILDHFAKFRREVPTQLGLEVVDCIFAP